MNKVGQVERETQNRIVKLFTSKTGLCNLLKEGTTQENKDTTQENDSTTQETFKTTQENKETTQEKIFALLRSKPMITREELAKSLGISSNGVKYHLDKLKELGKIRHLGSTKAGHWETIDE